MAAGVPISRRFEAQQPTIAAGPEGRLNTCDNGDRSGIAGLVFASAPGGPTLQAFGPAIGKTGVETGVSFDLDLSDSVSLWAAWDGAFQDATEAHSARAGLSIRF
jgi:uncharacterized protein with beta-barrel porin domain